MSNEIYYDTLSQTFLCYNPVVKFNSIRNRLNENLKSDALLKTNMNNTKENVGYQQRYH